MIELVNNQDGVETNPSNDATAAYDDNRKKDENGIFDNGKHGPGSWSVIYYKNCHISTLTLFLTTIYLA